MTWFACSLVAPAALTTLAPVAPLVETLSNGQNPLTVTGRVSEPPSKETREVVAPPLDRL